MVSSALSGRVRDARACFARAGGRDGGPEPALGERPRAADAPPARGLAAAGGDRGRARPARAAARGPRRANALDQRLTAIEERLERIETLGAEARGRLRPVGPRRQRPAPGSAAPRRSPAEAARLAPPAGSSLRRSAAARARAMSVTTSSAAASTATPSSPPSANRVAALHLNRECAPARPAAFERALVVEDVRSTIHRPAGGSRTVRAPGPGGSAAATRPRAGPGSPHPAVAPSARLVPSSAIASVATIRSPSSRLLCSAPQVPTRSIVVRAEVRQLGDHDRGARSTHPRALDRQRLAVGRGPV